MGRHALMPDNVHNKLCRRSEVREHDKLIYVEDWFVPIFRSRSNHLHVHVRPPAAIRTVYTRAELKKLRTQLYHPSPQRLCDLLKRVSASYVDAETLRALEEIASRFDTCQRVKRAPSRFRVSVGSEDLRFNERILIYVVKIADHNILHIVDEATRFNATRVLRDNSFNTIFRTLLESWALAYLGMPRNILVDKDSNFGPSFVQLARAWDSDVQHTGIESHNSLNVGKRYHEPLRTVCRKIMRENPEYNIKLVLAFATKTLNYTLGPYGIVPPPLVFGDHPSLSPAVLNNTPKATLKQRSKIAERCRIEMGRHLDMARVQRALRTNVPSSSQYVFESGDSVLVWRERQINNRIGDWLGPFLVDFFDDTSKILYVRNRSDSDSLPYSLAQVKPYVLPDAAADDFLTELHATVEDHGNATTDNDILLTEIIHRTDPRARSPNMKAARLKEVQELILRGTFRVVLEEELDDDSNILPGRFILAIKELNGVLVYKAGFCPGGHLDIFKDFLLHFTRTIFPETIRLLLALAALFGFDVWTADVTQAYLKSCHLLHRLLYLLTSAPEFNLKPGELLQVMLPL